MNNKSKTQIAMRVSWYTIVINVILSVYKLAAGLMGNSMAMVSDAVHSLSDVLSTIVVMIGFQFANKKEDKEHPYGHERLECVAAIILSGLLFATGMGIGYGGIRTIFAGNYNTIITPGKIALVAALVSIVVKEAMYWYTRDAAIKINSSAIMAAAWHHRSDALSSIGSFAGILGARIRFPVLDSVASLIICVLIAKASIDIFIDSINKMMDKACDDDIEEQIRQVILEQENVLGIDRLNTRLFGDKIYVDVEICMDGSVPLYVSHDIAHNVHDAVEENIKNVKHCMVHVNPSNLED